MTDGNTYEINKRLNDQEDWDALQEVAAELEQAEARIEGLEGKLAKAVEFTKGVIRHAGNSGDDFLAEQARTTLAELTKERSDEKGQDDE